MVPARPNTDLHFSHVDKSRPPLQSSPSPLNPEAWLELLREYPGSLGTIVCDILIYGTQIGYEGPEQLILSKNLTSSEMNRPFLTSQIESDLQKRRIRPVLPSHPLISSPLGLVPKSNGGSRRIHHLSHPRGRSVNDFIKKEYGVLSYVTLDEISRMVVQAGRGCLIIKRDIQEAFRIVPVAPHQQWLLGFSWEEQYYCETCLSFGLRTAPFIFNLFAEALQWILQAFFAWDLMAHYLDDFIRILPTNLLDHLEQIDHEYRSLTDVLGIPRNKSKDCQGTVIEVLGIELDSNLFEARLPPEKLHRAISSSSAALESGSLTLLEADTLAGFLSFCSQVVRLGRAFMSSLWEFISAFPPTQGRRRIPFFLRQDLRWWCSTLPSHNGVLFFDDAARPPIQLFTDACLTGMGGFFYGSSNSDWRTNVPLIRADHTFTASIEESNRDEHISFHEMYAILVALQRWGAYYTRSRLIINTDNTNAFHGLQSHRLRGNANQILRQVLCIAAQYDIVIEPKWLSSEENSLADALSRSDYNQVANICTHWQIPYNLV